MPSFTYAARGIGRFVLLLSLACHLAVHAAADPNALLVKQARAHFAELESRDGLSGVVLTAKAFLDRNPKASDEDIRKAMENVYCRCNTATRMMAAIKKYAEKGARA